MSGTGSPPATTIQLDDNGSNSHHSLGMTSAASSSVTSRHSQVLMDMFPVIQHSNMKILDNDLAKILSKVIKPRTSFINRLQDCSTNAMHKFLNRFSNTNLEITALTFASMGPQHFMDTDAEVRQQALRTIIVARYLKFGTNDLQPPAGESWSKVDRNWNKSVNITRETMEELEEMCEEPETVLAANKIMQEVRKHVRRLIRDPSLVKQLPTAASDNSYASTISGEQQLWTQQSNNNTTQLANKTPSKAPGGINPDIVDQANAAENVLNQLTQLHQPAIARISDGIPELAGFQRKLAADMEDLHQTLNAKLPSTRNPTRTCR